MRLRISHQTQYSYDSPLPYALQRIRLCPQSGPTQDVFSWKMDVLGAKEEVRFNDHFGNDTRLFSVTPGTSQVSILASGEVEVKDVSGVLGPHSGDAPLWLFQQETALTQHGPIATELLNGDERKVDLLEQLHDLSARIRQRVSYRVGATDASTTAEEALNMGEGVCQDHTHIFLSTARRLGVPARYVSGYLMLDDTVQQVATHAWAEAHIDGLGWVGFDVSNGISPDDRYTRIAVGRDYRDAMPFSGIRVGLAQELLEVHITVEQ